MTAMKDVQRTRVAGPSVAMEDGGLLDPVLFAIVRHHADSEEDRVDLVEFMRTGVVGVAQLRILLRHLGNRRPLLMDGFSTSTTAGRLPGRSGAKLRNATCTMSLDNGRASWAQGRLTVNRLKLPETVLSNLDGRPLGDVVDHPYLPGDLVITEARTLRAGDKDLHLTLRMP